VVIVTRGVAAALVDVAGSDMLGCAVSLDVTDEGARCSVCAQAAASQRQCASHVHAVGAVRQCMQ
jgi:hypothetical protein